MLHRFIGALYFADVIMYFVHLPVYHFIRPILIQYCVSGTVLGVKDRAVKKKIEKVNKKKLTKGP